ncbi:hypothetical protein BDB00DRAFT_870948 [Zychaea mexicana]|uniref:uncharacterized protein n=1 Tax=Zychaea mexicana TaxID=64656 RepID=UPI0022FDFB36|nr:uncharacterized protein BDB00DRAFT_870948 [Zychaea mexicana]KAI9494958.1 hypothetical protein BDB00DRAFT_870948 [Zychaea mexicana]
MYYCNSTSIHGGSANSHSSIAHRQNASLCPRNSTTTAIELAFTLCPKLQFLAFNTNRNIPISSKAMTKHTSLRACFSMAKISLRLRLFGHSRFVVGCAMLSRVVGIRSSPYSQLPKVGRSHIILTCRKIAQVVLEAISKALNRKRPDLDSIEAEITHIQHSHLHHQHHQQDTVWNPLFTVG